MSSVKLVLVYSCVQTQPQPAAAADAGQNHEVSLDELVRAAFSPQDYCVKHLTHTNDLAAILNTTVSFGSVSVGVVYVGQTDAPPEDAHEFVKRIRKQAPSAFRLVFFAKGPCTPQLRLQLVEGWGANMVSHVPAHVAAVTQVIGREDGSGKLQCPLCGKSKLTCEQLWYHLPTFHIVEKNVPMMQHACPVCAIADKASLLPHFHDEHAPPGEHSSRRVASTLYAFALCVIQRKSDQRFLVVQEYGNQGYWLPGGGIDPGERPLQAAAREALEETGMRVNLTGVLRVESSVNPAYNIVRMRYVFFGSPEDESAEPKTSPDFESVGACWVTLDEVMSNTLKLRGNEPREWFAYIAAGGPVYPMCVLGVEGSPAPRVETQAPSPPKQE